jgi:hypothetical protein
VPALDHLRESLVDLLDLVALFVEADERRPAERLVGTSEQRGVRGVDVVGDLVKVAIELPAVNECLQIAAQRRAINLGAAEEAVLRLIGRVDSEDDRRGRVLAARTGRRTSQPRARPSGEHDSRTTGADQRHADHPGEGANERRNPDRG